MRQRYIDYADYNIWANNRLIGDLRSQDQSVYNQEFVASFKTIRKTIQHIWYAEAMWLSRLKGLGSSVPQVTNFAGSNEELISTWQSTSHEFREFVDAVELEKEIYVESRGFSYLISSREIIQTVFNHGSFHRGQVVMMMRQLNITEITQTDYIEWVRANQRLSGVAKSIL